ncbi:hypothetical protein F5Y18DRAFT_427284 [Xylariaceae sp. FL1019]|nr:hypothetical protein F5Y18DRAFT_427284 [Xylariaceae sp. FL1019]
MRFLNIIAIATSVAAYAIDVPFLGREDLVSRHHAGRQGKGNRNGNGNGNANGNTNNNGAAANGNTSTTDTATGQTLVLTEINGVPGNECLTFRNNGEIVDAACVNEAADRQMTPTTVNGADALQIQRSFDAGFRADLADVQACVGFNGTHFLASDCSDSSVELVSFTGGELIAAGGACASGHDDLAQMTVDPTGQTCAQYTSTSVTPTAP